MGEQDDIPSAYVVMTAGLVAQAVHPDGDGARLEWGLHTDVDGLDDACGGVELTYLVRLGTTEVGLYELTLHVGFLEVVVVTLELGILLGSEPIGEAFTP